MKFLRQIGCYLAGWLTNTRSIIILVLVVVLWLELWAVNDTFFIDFNNIPLFHFISNGKINPKIIDALFFSMLAIAVVFSFVISVYDTLKEKKKK